MLTICGYINAIGRLLAPMKIVPQDVVSVCHQCLADPNVVHEINLDPAEGNCTIFSVNPIEAGHFEVSREDLCNYTHELSLQYHRGSLKPKALSLLYVLRMNNGEHIDTQTVCFRFDGVHAEYTNILNQNEENVPTIKDRCTILDHQQMTQLDGESIDLFVKILKIEYDDCKTSFGHCL